MTKPRVAFLGLGIMGGGMARRIAGAGFPLTVYNRNRDKAAALMGESARIANSARDAAAQAEIVISMVADDAASRSIWLGEQGVVAGASRGSVFIESSTVSPAWIRELADAATKQGCEVLDAPVTGSKIHAASGELNFLVGGSAAALDRARPVLAVMSKSITHVGPTGSGALIKLINNFLCGVQAASLAEALALIERSDLDRAKALEILSNGTPGSPLVKTVLPRMTNRDYTPNFFMPLMAKDLTYSVNEGERRGVKLTTVASALEVFKAAIGAGLGEKDFSAIAELFRDGNTQTKL